jgi:hypothetical protein
VIVDRNGLIWVPPANSLRLRILVIGHAGLSGHFGIGHTIANVCDFFVWDSLEADAVDFVKSCLHCRGNKGALAHPRPLGEALHGAHRNDVLHFDYLYMKRCSRAGYTYILVLKDAFTGYIELVPCIACDAKTTVEALLGWISRYGTLTRSSPIKARIL